MLQRNNLLFFVLDFYQRLLYPLGCQEVKSLAEIAECAEFFSKELLCGLCVLE